MSAPAPDQASELQQLYERKAAALRASPMDRPLLIESQDRDQRVAGDLYAVLDHPLADLKTALGSPGQWCAMLTLLPTIRHCGTDASARHVMLHFARRFDQPLADTEAVSFAVRIERQSMRHFGIALSAKSGPLGTRDYRITLHAMPLDDRSSFLHLHYGYRYGFAAKLAAQLYLSTSGRDKRGFTVVDDDADGPGRYVGGMRASIERNAMRLYLALDAHLRAQRVPVAQRYERSLQLWLQAIERYPLQLAEADPDAYLAAKRAAR